LNHWLKGFFISIIILFLLIGFEFQLGALKFSDTYQVTLKLICQALAAGLVVGLIEEVFFRGFVFLKLNRNLKSTQAALILTNLFYALVHFLRSGRPYVDETPTMFDSLRLIGASFHAFVQLDVYWPSMVGLFLFGLVLSFSFLRTRSLAIAMGLHGGAVFVLKLTSRWYVVEPHVSDLVYGGRGFYSGLLGWLFILFIGLVIHRLARPSETS